MRKILLIALIIMSVCLVGCQEENVEVVENNIEVENYAVTPNIEEENTKNTEDISNNEAVEEFSLNNTLSYDEMVEKLKLTVYSNLEKSNRGLHEGTDVDNFIYDIDNNGVPEIIYTGVSIYAQPEDTLQVFTIKDDKVVSTIHEFSLVSVPMNIYQTEEGVFVYQVTGNGPEAYETLYKLELNGLELTKEEVVGSIEINNEDSDLPAQNTYKVYGSEVSVEEYNSKIDELKALKVTKSLTGAEQVFN